MQDIHLVHKSNYIYYLRVCVYTFIQPPYKIFEQLIHLCLLYTENIWL